MLSSEILNKIYDYFSSVKNINSNHIYFLEEAREKIIDQMRDDKNKMSDLFSLIQKNNIEDKVIKLDKINIKICLTYNNEKIETKKEELKNDILEIVLVGKKDYNIFDLNDQKRHINYYLTPIHGVVYSAKTHISTITSANSMLILIIINKEK